MSKKESGNNGKQTDRRPVVINDSRGEVKGSNGGGNKSNNISQYQMTPPRPTKGNGDKK